MIDTVILIIPKEKVISLNNTDNRFPNWTKNIMGNYFTYIKNSTRFDIENGLSFIKMTGYITSFDTENANPIMVNIEFSVPKLIYGNNLDEISENQFQTVIDRLHERLISMGELVDKADLENALVSRFHVSKNTVITGGYSSSSIINELNKINLTKKLELTKVNFKNSGHSLQMFALSHSIVFYDKILDLNQHDKKAIDQEQTKKQFSLFSEIKTHQPNLEVLRMEVRFNKKRKMNSILSKLGFRKNPTFKDIFKKEVCQKIIKWYWDNIIKDENLFLFELSNNPKQLYKDILRKNPKMKVKQAIFMVGLNILCKDEGGIRELRRISEKRITQRNWYCINNNIKLLNTDPVYHDWVNQIDYDISSFKPFHYELGPP